MTEKISSFVEFYQSLDRNKIYEDREFDNMYLLCFLRLLIDAGWEIKRLLLKTVGWKLIQLEISKSMKNCSNIVS